MMGAFWIPKEGYRCGNLSGLHAKTWWWGEAWWWWGCVWGESIWHCTKLDPWAHICFLVYMVSNTTQQSLLDSV